MSRTPLSFAAGLSAVALVLAACGGDDDSQQNADNGAAEQNDDRGSDAEAGDDTGGATAGTDGDATGGDEAAATDDGDATDGAATSCSPEQLQTVTAGSLTLSTSEPAFEPWMVDNDPANAEGFESAVAYAVAEELGFDAADVTWVRNQFEATIAPGPKDFDLAINQFSITEDRRQAVDFTSGYYDVRQAVVSREGLAAADATSLEDLKGVLIGAQVGTTSLTSVQESVQPDATPLIFNTNEEAKLALDNGQVDAIVVDLPTAFYLTAVEIEGGVIVGQLPLTADTEQLGFVLDLDSELTDCATAAVDALREDGTLDALAQEWLADVAGAPELR